MVFSDLHQINKAYLNRRSIVPCIGRYGQVVFDPTIYTEIDGIRYFKRPLKVAYDVWVSTITDLSSIVYHTSDTGGMVYVFAVSTMREYNDRIASVYVDECIDKNYGLLDGLQSTFFS